MVDHGPATGIRRQKGTAPNQWSYCHNRYRQLDHLIINRNAFHDRLTTDFRT
jgi:hypothetical protein